MTLILGIESSCDETAAAVFDTNQQKLLSSSIFSQVKLHEKYGGVVPEIASRSHMKKIGIIVQQALDEASVNLNDIGTVAVTNKPGLAGSLLIGMCFAKGVAWAGQKKLIGIDHLEAHIYSSFLNDDGSIRDDLRFPHICLVASGGHTSLYLVKDFGDYKLIGQTLDDAAGEAFDKVAKLIGLGYPGGPIIERLARENSFKDAFSYPRTKQKGKSLDFSFSGLKTAVLYDLVKRGAFDLETGIIADKVNEELQRNVASSLLVCISEIIQRKFKVALRLYPQARAITFVGGVACNKYLKSQLADFAEQYKIQFFSPHSKYCGDNAAMIAFVGGYKDERKEYDSITLDVFE